MVQHLIVIAGELQDNQDVQHMLELLSIDDHSHSDKASPDNVITSSAEGAYGNSKQFTQCWALI